MKTHELKDQKTKEALELYSTYTLYKKNAVKAGAWGITTLETRYGSFNKAKEHYGLETVDKYNCNRGDLFTDDELLEAVKKFDTKQEYIDNRTEEMPGTFIIERVFGSWTDARIAAGFMPKDGTMNEDKPTTVYLVWFIEDDIFKVGITQRTLKHRGKQWPEFAIVDTVSTTLKSAKILEKQLKEKYVKPYGQFYYEIEGDGATECFLFDDIPSLKV